MAIQKVSTSAIFCCKDTQEYVCLGVSHRENINLSSIRLSSSPFVDPFIWWCLGCALLCVLGPLSLDLIEDVPITLQTLVVMILPALLGIRIATLSVLGYLLIGMAGAPVFSSGKGGWEIFLGPTAGFLIGFLPAAWLTGKMVHHPWGQSWLTTLLAMLAGHQIVLLFGLPWYGWLQGWEKVLPLWAKLTPGMVVKVLLATILVILIRLVLTKISRRPKISG